MNGARGHILAGAGFSVNDDVALRFRRLEYEFIYLAHGLALAHHAAQTEQGIG